MLQVQSLRSRAGARVFSLVLLLCALFTLALIAQGWCSNAQTVELTIIHTNDLHGHLFPFDYDSLGKHEPNVGGAARRASLIRQLKASTHHSVLVMDAGDIFTRGPLQDLHGAPDMAVLNAIPCDIMTIGNGEFEGAPGPQGRKILNDLIKQARFAMVSANVIDKSTGKTLVPAYKVFDCGGLRVGVFGLITPRVAYYEQARGLEIADPIETAKKIVSELKPKSDFIIALTHLGYPLDLQLASSVPAIDVIIGGDGRTWFFQPALVKSENTKNPDWWVGGPIVCQDGEWGKCVGKLDLILREAAPGTYRVASYSGRLVDVDSSVKPARDVRANSLTIRRASFQGHRQAFSHCAQVTCCAVDCEKDSGGRGNSGRDDDSQRDRERPEAGEYDRFDIRRMFSPSSIRWLSSP